MTKTAKTTTAVVTPEPATPTVLTFGKLPRTIPLSGMAHQVFGQLVVLARQGYVVDTTTMVQVFPATGLAFVQVTLGTPDESIIQAATEATELALAVEEREFTKAVEEAAARLIDERAAAAKKAVVDAEIEAAEVALAALKRAAK